MPLLTMTAAEIAAAEAAAIAAAEAAAVHAAQVAAAQAAQAAATTAANTAAANTATATATNAATNQSVLNAIGAGGAPVSTAVGAGGAGGGISTLGAGAGTGANLGYETLAKEVNGIEQVLQVFQDAQASNVPMSQAEFLNQSFAGPAVDTGSQLSQLIPATPSAPPFDPAQPFAYPTYPTYASAPPAAPTPVDISGVSPNTGPSPGGAGTGYQGSPIQIGSASNAVPYTPAELQAMQGQSPSGIEGLFNQGLDYAKNNKLTTLIGANTLYNALNKPDPYEKPKYKSTFKPGLYSGYTPVQPTPYQPRYADGGVADLGGYSDYARGGRMLKGPGDGMSDDIPATIANKQPARLANEEFVVPADVVSHLGNGSSEAGAKQLYKMMDRIRKARTGTKKQGKQINPEKFLA